MGHLFNTAGQILCVRRCKLSDKHFNMFVFLGDFLISLKSVNCEMNNAQQAQQPF